MNLALEVTDLHYQYPDGTVALRGVSFLVEEGSCVALIGPNGSGKSTLLLHLNGLLPETRRQGGSGVVKVLGEEIEPRNLLRVRRQVGLLFQDPNDQLFCPTVYEDVAFGPRQMGLEPPEVNERVVRALGLVGLTGRENRPPHHLSGGEKRRACLAGLLATDARILVLDEPTANLDPRGRRELKQLVRDIALTRLIASHDLEFVAEVCDTAIVLDEGRVIAAGPAREILGNEAMMEAHGLETPHFLRHAHPHNSPPSS
jgi:cobalt/nickel transport system ATP-binding protein